MDADDGQSLLSQRRGHNRRHSKVYDRMDSWVKLVKVGTIKLMVTVFFGGILCICLKAWEGFSHPLALSVYDVRIFNALTIAISICLGLNLLSSLRRYAVILRWAILTKRHVSMEAFDLILGIDELTNVVKLMVLSLPSLRKRKWLIGKPRNYVDMNPGTNHWYVYACAVWLLVNIGSQVLVASLSLFWPMQPYECQLTKYGQVAVADLSGWVDNPDNVSPQITAWTYGMDAQSWPWFPANESHTELSKLPGTPVYKALDNSSYEYRFFYRNPNSLYSDYKQSDRCIQTRATCDEYDIQGPIQAKPARHVVARVRGTESWDNVSIPLNGYGMITYISHKKSCAPRCSTIDVFQYEDEEDADNKAVTKTSLWRCKNTVHSICNTEGINHTGIDVNDQRIYSNDTFAQLAAGAIGWTGVTQSGISDLQFRAYPQGTPWSPRELVDTAKVQDIIMRFTIGAIAAFDDHGIRHNITINHEVCNKDSQRLNVSWRYLSSILAAIGLIQFGALCYLLARANRAIVRDASFFSTAMLLKPVLEEIGDEPGLTAMSGEKIKDHPKLRYRKIIYGYEDMPNGEPRRIKVLFQRSEKGHKKGKWPSGEYGG
ncbi:hypothetical protein BU25DRAFT_328205 [Macroventuria anomochaeta]|uniref:Uncharacterized protein n=1 Tax=Macroventuria anomochaeta TaxID=301207 RepID=A0ACB6SGI3_9PLEO|nr:uncharacterized protein BU25DRAFT_328205 [Macroventuria anomochaeta]KAF2633346.1 hypothetical protein BU25DRAFT_328205 [Macroventuria anomochaeta]